MLSIPNAQIITLEHTDYYALNFRQLVAIVKNQPLMTLITSF